MKHSSFLTAFVTFSGMMMAGIILADDVKTQAGNSGPQGCMACHESNDTFKRIPAMWEASGHSKSLNRVTNSTSSPDCYSCHSEEGFKAKLVGKKVDLAQKDSFHSVTCTTCHNVPHNTKYPHQLVQDPEDLCSSCHTQRSVLQGKGAKGIDEMRSFHSGVECYSCHMSEGNHFMKVLRPDDATIVAPRLDTCTTCHKDNNRTARAGQLKDWQSTYKQEMDPLQADLNAINAALKEKPGLLNDPLKAKLNDTRANLLILTKDMSQGVHNFDFALEIMSLAAKDLKEIKAAIK
jgi:predicted CXXCH cytochrome family protein